MRIKYKDDIKNISKINIINKILFYLSKSDHFAINNDRK